MQSTGHLTRSMFDRAAPWACARFERAAAAPSPWRVYGLSQVTDAYVDFLVVLQQRYELLRVVVAVGVRENDLRLHRLHGIGEIRRRHRPDHRQKRGATFQYPISDLSGVGYGWPFSTQVRIAHTYGNVMLNHADEIKPRCHPARG
jgi:hypothetical protein